jgi:glycosyltransferase involved in cell wall biosynthesis
LYAAADLVCLPSQHEGQPVSLIEAMAMGTPVATSGPWVPDELLPFAAVDSDPGRMVRAGLTLSERINRAELRGAVLSRYTWDQIAGSYVAVFERVSKSS